MEQKEISFISIENEDISHLARLERLKNAVDSEGRIFCIDSNEDKIYFTDSITNEKRCLGRVLIGDKNLLYYKMEDERNIFRNTNSWSINYTIFEQVDDIVYETFRYLYRIPVQRALEFGEIVHHKGTEKKIYIPLKYWDKRHRGVSEKEQRQRNLLGDSWFEKLNKILNSDHMKALGTWLKKERNTKKIYPEESDTFRAFKLCSFEHTKVVILGQDPYYQPNTADGLAFSYKQGCKQGTTKALDLIIEEVQKDCYDFNLNFNYDLSIWAKQGVLLLNTVLTVEKGKPLSHWDIGWRRFTRKVLFDLIKDPTPKVFLLWGTKARETFKEAYDLVGIRPGPHLWLSAKHPAADLHNSAKDTFGHVIADYPNTFLGCRHFSQANDFLVKNKRKAIKW